MKSTMVLLNTKALDPAIKGYQYCASLQIAFESLIFKNHTDFMGCNGVAIDCSRDFGLKIFHCVLMLGMLTCKFFSQ